MRFFFVLSFFLNFFRILIIKLFERRNSQILPSLGCMWKWFLCLKTSRQFGCCLSANMSFLSFSIFTTAIGKHRNSPYSRYIVSLHIIFGITKFADLLSGWTCSTLEHVIYWRTSETRPLYGVAEMTDEAQVHRQSFYGLADGWSCF